MPALAIAGVDLGIWVVALAAILVLLAAWVFFRLIELVLRHVPYIGSYIGHVISSWLARAVATTISWADGSCRAVTHWVWAAAVGYWHLLYKEVEAVKHAALLASFGVRLAIGNLTHAKAYTDHYVSLLVNDIHGAENALVAYANAGVADAERFASGLAGTLVNDIHGAENALVAYADHAVAALAGVVTGEISQIRQTISTLDNLISGGIATLSSQIVADLHTAIADADAAAAAAEQAAVNAAHTIAAVAAGGVVADLDAAAADVLNPALAALLPALGTIAGSIPNEIAQALGLPRLLTIPKVSTLAGALALLAPAVAAIATETAECGVPICRNLSGLSNLIAGLSEAAVWAGLVALLVEAVNDPARAVDGLRDGLGGPVRATARAFTDLIGV